MFDANTPVGAYGNVPISWDHHKKSQRFLSILHTEFSQPKIVKLVENFFKISLFIFHTSLFYFSFLRKLFFHLRPF